MEDLIINRIRYTEEEAQEILDALYGMEFFGQDVPETQAELDRFCEEYFEEN